MKNWFRKISHLAVAALCSVLSFNTFGAASLDEMLSRLTLASNTLSFQGTLTYTQGVTSKAMKIVRSVDESGFQERIFALSGTPSEILRNNKGVWCYFPEKKEGYFKASDESSIRIPFVENLNLDKLSKLYSIHLAGRERIADRWATRASITSKDGFRYSLHVWLDEVTGLLLRSDLLDQSGMVIDSYMFVDIKILNDSSIPKIEPTYSGENYNWYFAEPNMAELQDKSAWSVNMVPDGFQKIKHVHGVSSDVANEKIFFSDGLASVMVTINEYVKPEENPNFEGPSQLGAVHAYGRIINNFQVTVMGEVPAETVYQIAQAITHQRQFENSDQQNSTIITSN